MLADLRDRTLEESWTAQDFKWSQRLEGRRRVNVIWFMALMIDEYIVQSWSLEAALALGWLTDGEALAVLDGDWELEEKLRVGQSHLHHARQLVKLERWRIDFRAGQFTPTLLPALRTHSARIAQGTAREPFPTRLGTCSQGI